MHLYKLFQLEHLNLSKLPEKQVIIAQLRQQSSVTLWCCYEDMK